MSDHGHPPSGQRIRRATIAAGLLLAAPLGTVEAQSADEYRRRLEILEPQWRAARASVDAKEQARRQAARTVTLERGALRLVVDSTLVPLVAGPAEIAARTLEATFGNAVSIVSEHPLAVRTDVSGRGADTIRVIRIGTPGRETTIAIGDSLETRHRLIGALSGARITAALHAALDDSARNWVRAALPAGRESAGERERIYVELVTASTGISRRCLDGENLGCRELLGLAPVHDPLVRGHTAEQRRAAVVARSPQLRVTGYRQEFDRCVADHDDAACTARLRTLPTETFTRSVGSSEMRRSFLRSALDRGGPYAYDRLRSTASLPLDARFAAAGNAPVDTLIAAWRTGILAARPARTPITPTAALATLGWILAAGALALRSSRWR